MRSGQGGRRARPWMPRRRPIFLGCEGESERGYGGLLRRLLEDIRPDRHLEVVLLQPGGGDPLALVKMALDRIARNQGNRSTRYMARALLLDSDRFGETPARSRAAETKAAAGGLRL